MSGWIRASNVIPKKLRVSGVIDTGKHPELARLLVAAPFRSGMQLMIDLMEDGLRLRGVAIGGIGADATTVGVEPVKRGRGRPPTRGADNPISVITLGSTASSEVARGRQPAPAASHEPAAMQQAEPLPEQVPPRVAADTGFVLEPSPSCKVAKPGSTSPRRMAND